ncbi:MAG: hypothetical protein PHH98_01020 [Candidatus Gracilibacteria bacterium]|nr:hypothetical protein [Candidatus Gracilibacteria bacterium]
MSDLDIASNKETGIENSSQKKESLFNKFILDFSNNYFEGENKNSRIDSIFKSNDLTPDLKKSLEMFLALKSEEFSSGITRLDLDKINVFDFRKKLIGKHLELENSRLNLKNIVLNSYELSKEQKILLENKIKTLSDDDILRYTKNEVFRTKLMKKTFPDLVKKQDRIKDFFIKYDLLTGYSELSTEKKEAIMNIFNNDGTLKKIDITIIDDLFSAGIFSLEQKKEIVSYFIPTISFSDIRKLKLFGDSTGDKINKIKTLKVEEFLKDNDVKLENDEEKSSLMEKLVSLINDESIKITTDDLFSDSDFSSEKLDELINGSDFSDFVSSYNSFLDDVSNYENSSEFSNGFDTFKTKLNELNNVYSIENFKEGNYIVLDLYLEGDEKADKQITKQYFKINKFNDGSYSFGLTDSGFGSIDFFSTDSKDITYKNFFQVISKGFKINSEKYIVSKCNFLTRESIDGNVKKGEINVLNNDGKTDTELEDELKINDLNEELILLNKRFELEILKGNEFLVLDKEIESINIELKNKNITDDKKSELILKLENLKNEKERLLIEKSNLDLLSPELKELKLDINFKEIELDNLKNIYSLEKLINCVDEFDSAGKKFKFQSGMSFSSSKGIFTITRVDNGTIDVTGIGGETKDIPYKDFFEEFKKIKSKRLSSTTDSSLLISNILSDNSLLDSGLINTWNDFEYKNNSIQKKNSTKNIEYNYLKAKDSNDLLEIESISGDRVVINMGEYEDYKKDKDGNIKKDKDGNKIEEKNITMYSGGRFTVSISWLDAWIKENNARPSSLDENKDVESSNVKGEKISGSFLSRYMNRISVHDLMAGMKLGVDSIESYLKEGSEEKSAKAAQGIFGLVLPDALKNDLMTRVEESQKKRSDDYVSKLGNVDSWKAASMIISWLKNKDAPQYLKEAGAIFMLQKYGVLYAKDLYDYKGSFLFYESFGGKIGDKLYEEVKADAKKTNQNFTEEQLLFRLVNLQCKEQGYNGVKRRSRYHKEFKKHRNVGKQDEYETGKGDAKDERTVGARIKGGVGELKGGTYANARGWLEEAINKGGSMEEMNKIPFIISFSGISYNFEQNELDQFKNFPASSRMVPVLRFLSYSNDTDLINETILEVCKRYSEIKGKEGIYKDALKIFSNQKTNTISEKKKIEQTEAFYSTYGKDITDILYMLNTGDTSSNSYLSKMILIEKDDRINDNGEEEKGNVIFKRYFDSLHAYTGEFVWGNDDLFGDAFSGKGTSGINVYKATKELLQQIQGGTYKFSSAGPAMWDEIRNEIDAVINRDYGIYGKSGQRTDLKNMIRGFVGGLLEAHGTNSMALRSLVSSNSSPIYSKSKEWGIDLTKIMKYSYVDINEGRAESLVDEYVDILLNGGSSTITTSKLDDTIFGVKSDVNDSL